MVYNSDKMPFPANNSFFQDPVAFGGDAGQQRDDFYFPSRPSSPLHQGAAPSENPFPYPYANEAAAPFMENSFEWYGPPDSGRDRMPAPPQTIGSSQLERRLRVLERRQEQFERDLERMDRRLRIIERRLGFPIPPGGIPGMPR